MFREASYLEVRQGNWGVKLPHAGPSAPRTVAATHVPHDDHASLLVYWRAIQARGPTGMVLSKAHGSSCVAGSLTCSSVPTLRSPV